MESIQSALFTHTAKHVYSFQEEWAAVTRKTKHDEGRKALPEAPDTAVPSLPLSTL